MQIKGIDIEKCTQCGACIQECAPDVISKFVDETNPKGTVVKYDDPYDACSRCGHCLAICPTEAIDYSDAEPTFASEGVKKPQDVPYSTIMEIIRARRSIRQYKDKPVPKEEIEAVLEAMRYAPSASNEQNWEYMVFTDRKQIQTFSKKVTSVIELTHKLVSNKIISNVFIWGNTRKLVKDPSFLYSMGNLIKKVEEGKDPIFFNAPCVIVLHSPVYGNMAGCDSGIALTHGMLAAQSRGLGTCWIGIAQETVQRIKKLAKWLGIPKGRKVWGVMILGYPKVKFLRAPPRKPLAIEWK
ncbi:MAG: 4Fe-4S dicluster domain-containing protein [Promethearchaeota archaeon]|nr:MAG: 4Fe-4S dicluster domain-containing protein [Candidatus Lokiarchaeota archaeon]